MNSEIIKRFRRSMRRRNICKIDANTARRFIKFLQFIGMQIYIRNGKLFIGEISYLFSSDKPRFLAEHSIYLKTCYQRFLNLYGINS